MGADLSEIFSISRISQITKMVGLIPGKCYDIANGFDLLNPQVRNQVFEELCIAKPKLVVVCLSCDQCSSICDMIGFKGSVARVRKILKTKILLRFAMQIGEQKIKQDNLFLFEYPHSARSWQDRYDQHIGKLYGVGNIIFDQCIFGLRDVQSDLNHRKYIRVMSNNGYILHELDRVHDNNHIYQQLLDKVRHEGSWQNRSRLTQKYPEELCKAVMRDLL